MLVYRDGTYSEPRKQIERALQLRSFQKSYCALCRCAVAQNRCAAPDPNVALPQHQHRAFHMAIQNRISKQDAHRDKLAKRTWFFNRSCADLAI
jgi:hypothetical protein